MQVFEVSSTFCTFLCSGIRPGIRVDWKSEKKSTQRGFLINLNITWLYILYIIYMYIYRCIYGNPYLYIHIYIHWVKIMIIMIILWTDKPPLLRFFWVLEIPVFDVSVKKSQVSPPNDPHESTSESLFQESCVGYGLVNLTSPEARQQGWHSAVCTCEVPRWIPCHFHGLMLSIHTLSRCFLDDSVFGCFRK